jgi:hypothetical protein
MIQMNSRCAQILAQHHTGIFRADSFINAMNDKSDFVNSQISADEKRVVKFYKKNNNIDKYVCYSDGCLENYVQITSPIRRLVDLLNYMKLMKILKHELSEDGDGFVNTWLSKIDYINTTMRMIRKVEMNCDLMNKCLCNPELLLQEHRGLVFDGIQKSDGVYTYAVYIESIRLLTRVTLRNECENYSKHSFKLYVFDDEYNTRKKIRLQMI